MSQKELEKSYRVKHQRKFDDVKHTLRILEGILEVCILSLLYYFVWKFFYREVSAFPYYGMGKYILAGIYTFMMVALFQFCDCFKYGFLKYTDVVISQCVATFLVNFITYFQLCLMANHMLNPLPMAGLVLLDWLIAALFIYVYTRLYHTFYVQRHMALIYGSDNALTLKLKMDTRRDKYYIEKLISVEEGYEKICEQIKEYDAIVINDIDSQLRNDLIKYCYLNDIRAYVVPKLSDIIVRGADDITLFDTPLVLIKDTGLTLLQRFLKRFMDLFLCMVAMIPGSVIMLIVAIAIKSEDGGPVFYRQERVTMNGKKFDILKFRSMIVDAEKEGKSIPATDKDPRITKVGNVIRATRIDELPQLINIIKGDMSIVGPRPERTEHVEKYSEEIPEFIFRTKVKGGLTGYAQIFGKYNTSAYDKLRLDLFYIENYSLMLDIKLILMTIRIMLKAESTEGFDKVVSAEMIKEMALTEEE